MAEETVMVASDLLEELKEPLSAAYGDELERCLAAVYPVAMRLGRRVSVKPLTREECEQGDSPLLREVRRSGIACHARCRAA